MECLLGCPRAALFYFEINHARQCPTSNISTTKERVFRPYRIIHLSAIGYYIEWVNAKTALS